MKQQPRSRKQTDMRIRQRWSVEPAVSYQGTVPLIAVKLGSQDTIFIPGTMATHLADALVDAVEDGITTDYRNKTNRKIHANQPAINTTHH